jgi:hypothetical protein
MTVSKRRTSQNKVDSTLLKVKILVSSFLVVMIFQNCGPGLQGIDNVPAAVGNGATAANIFVPVSMAPSAPSLLVAGSTSSTAISLTWKDTSGAANLTTSFTIERANLLTGANETYTVIATLPANIAEYDDINLAPSTFYLYQITASNNFGTSPATLAVLGATLHQ